MHITFANINIKISINVQIMYILVCPFTFEGRYTFFIAIIYLYPFRVISAQNSKRTLKSSVSLFDKHQEHMFLILQINSLHKLRAEKCNTCCLIWKGLGKFLCILNQGPGRQLQGVPNCPDRFLHEVSDIVWE